MTMFESLLIANRGEIARRIIRTARRMGIKTVAVHSDADAAMPFVKEADRAILIGPAAARESYLVPEKIIAAARATGAAAIHPGYGFLSENAAFAECVQAAGLIWVGAPPAAIRAMGLKDAAKRRMQEAGVPVTPGYLGEDQSGTALQAKAEEIGFPVLIKAVAGGGGKGMRRVDTALAFADALEGCQREAAAAFGDDRVLIEKYVLSPRHIEVQVFGDTRGEVVHLFERDCSLQRRHQKVIEEAPAPGMDAATRSAVCAAAVKAAKAVDYVGAGTIEFIADASEGLRADRIWFMEMNTGLQVEHPVTEAITGQDLVEWQLRVANGEPLPCRQEELSIKGWAMEARLYAENPASGFLPSIGRLDWLRLPDNIRVDSGVEERCEITTHYDPLIAKLVVHAPDRATAAAELAKAAGAVEVWPVKTNAAFLMRAANDADFVAGLVDTGFIERHAGQLMPASDPPAAVLQAAAQTLLSDSASIFDPWRALQGLRINAEPDRRVGVEVAGIGYVIDVDICATIPSVVEVGGERLLFFNGEAWPFVKPVAKLGDGGTAAPDGAMVAPMPGQITTLAVTEGQAVMRGQKLLTLEAMKMEHTLSAPFDGVITEIKAAVGRRVAEGSVLMRVSKD